MIACFATPGFGNSFGAFLGGFGRSLGTVGGLFRKHLVYDSRHNPFKLNLYQVLFT